MRPAGARLRHQLTLPAEAVHPEARRRAIFSTTGLIGLRWWVRLHKHDAETELGAVLTRPCYSRQPARAVMRRSVSPATATAGRAH